MYACKKNVFCLSRFAKISFFYKSGKNFLYFLQNSLILLRMSEIYYTFVRFFGKMAEWSIAAVLKTVDLKGFGGSNPSLSAGRIVEV